MTDLIANLQPGVILAGPEGLIVVLIWVVIIVVGGVVKLLQKMKETQQATDRNRKKSSGNDQWGGQSKAAAPPPPPPRRRRRRKSAGTPPPVPHQPPVSAAERADARDKLEAAQLRQQLQQQADVSYEAKEAYHEEDHSGEVHEVHERDAYAIQDAAHRRRKHKAADSLRKKGPARRAILMREILDRPRAFDI